MENAGQLAELKVQLAQVEEALKSAPRDEELMKVRDDLRELIATLQQLAAAGAAAVPSGAEGGASGHHGGERAERGRLAPGDKVSALYVVDGRWYDATVTGVEGGRAVVTYDGYDEEATLDLSQVRERPASSEPQREDHGGKGGTRAVDGDGDADAEPAEDKKKKSLHIPVALQIKPDDTPEEAERKKKKLNAIKRRHNAQEREEVHDTSRANWQQFMGKRKMAKYTRSHHDPRYDFERDHQEVARSMRAPSNMQRDGF